VVPPSQRPINQAGLSHLAYRVPEIDDAARRIAECGGKVLDHTRVTMSLADGSKCEAVFCEDPDGTQFELLTMPAPVWNPPT
jgi:predicted enzyme related to lactoylglutathione lyase